MFAREEVENQLNIYSLFIIQMPLTSENMNHICSLMTTKEVWSHLCYLVIAYASVESS
jgi:hypothetical protein